MYTNWIFLLQQSRGVPLPFVDSIHFSHFSFAKYWNWKAGRTKFLVKNRKITKVILISYFPYCPNPFQFSMIVSVIVSITFILRCTISSIGWIILDCSFFFFASLRILVAKAKCFHISFDNRERKYRVISINCIRFTEIYFMTKFDENSFS